RVNDEPMIAAIKSANAKRLLLDLSMDEPLPPLDFSPSELFQNRSSIEGQILYFGTTSPGAPTLGGVDSFAVAG
ncbi:hypothetical protein, partial [Candidatus Binatus sp.]|uniref:hypothetical protein n=1 Tax=Candidatus Binatus sp. TaxID=2811406 RepID=UPI003C78B9C7